MTDQGLLLQISTELKITLTQTGKFNERRTGYVLDNTGNLISLSLTDCKVKDLSRIISSLKQFKYLSELSLASNQIKDISSISVLTGLNILDLTNNQISNIKPLESLRNLEFLSLYGNKITDITPIKNLYKLATLYIGANKLTDISPLKDLVNLQILYSQFNNIKDISPLKHLKELTFIWLWSNHIEDISPLRYLQKLQEVGLSSNNIQILPEWILDLNLHIVYDEGGNDNKIHIGNNPIVSPPIEIINQGRESLYEWYKATKKQLNEIKIILIGDPKAGKTSILRRLIDDSFNEKEIQTDGINIENISFGESKTFEKQQSIHNVIGHFWDFGGQEIMNATHQFFLTNRSIYLLVLDSRKDSNVSSQIRQWVKRIKATGGNSPIIVVANQSDINAGFGFSNEYEIQHEFPQVKYFITASCKTGKGIDLIKEKLEILINEAELFKTEIDERWLKIKETLQEETLTNHFLDETRFIETCNHFGLHEKESRKNLINFLHDLGLVLHFEELNLSEYYVLDPYWITYGVYQILTSTYAGKVKGVVNMDKLEYIINEEEDKKETYRPSEYRKIIYTPNQRRFLVDILNQFKLSFYLPCHSRFIIPDLLETNEPNHITESFRNGNNSIQFIYEYGYLPRSTMPHIMVTTHRIIQDKWRTGCVLEYKDCRALISNYQSRLSITVTGEHKKKREFMAIIRHLIDSINQNLSDKPQMLIPLPDMDVYADYEELLEREKDGEKYYTVYKPIKRKHEISLLLEGIPTQDEIKEVINKIDIVLTNQTEITNKLNEHYKYLIQISENKIIQDSIISAIKEIEETLVEKISNEIMQILAITFDHHSADIDDKLKYLYSDLKKTDNLEMKLKLGVPLINLLGIELETKFDIKKWAKKMYGKYELKLFKLMGYM